MISAPRIELPKGGGAIRGMGEKFAVNPVTGTASFSIPLGASPGRAGFGADLTLGYDSAAGNGPFGLGWGLGQPEVTRKTDTGLPRYDDAADSDVFILSGAEDLVPAPDVLPDRDGYAITRFRPRTEGLFARIERWSSRTDPADVFWQSISADDVTTVYGRDDLSRVRDPEDPTRIFSWLVTASHDAFGNAMAYEYTAEDGDGVDAGLPYERGRSRSQRYLTRIRYGNRDSRLDPDHAGDWDSSWLFEVLLDYGEGLLTDDPADDGHRYVRLTPGGARPVRPDPFSTCRAGFEVRTYRRCERVLMFHQFDELGAEPTLVRDIAFTYTDDSGYSLLTSVTASGHRRVDDRYRTASMPPLDLGYSRAVIGTESRTLIPSDLAGPTQWVDLDGEGVPGALTRRGNAWWYQRNLGGGRFGGADLQRTSPSTAGRLLDLAGDGSLDLVDVSSTPGYYERTDDADWSEHHPFTSWPNLRWDDPDQRLTDLTGDGLPDVLVLRGNSLTWHRSLGEQGFSAPMDEHAPPALVFADGTDSLFLADMSGDGLSDLVRVGNGDIRYWPNLGYGRFGSEVVMADAPVLDVPGTFDARRVRLADIDGSGPSDLLYLADDGINAHLNRSGNAWSAAVAVTALPQVDDHSDVEAVDLLGTGTTCLMWSAPHAAAGPQLRYVELMAEGKPHLLTRVTNNLGAETRVIFESSTAHYLRDAEAGTPWVTRLPFPVHVVAAVETRDLVAGNSLATTYAYHHGYFDGHEREFRGFGGVDQRDSETFDQRPAAANQDPAFHVPPVLTRTWFHTGAPAARGRLTREFAGEYSGPNLLPDSVVPAGLTDDEEREACRALRGTVLRQEVYGLDGSDRERHPYLVCQANAGVRLLQPRGSNRHAVFLTHPLESVRAHHDRDPDDPRTSHELTLAVNDFGQVTRSASIGYGRRTADPDLPAPLRSEQTTLRTVCTDSTYTDPVDGPDEHRAPALHTQVTYDVVGLSEPITMEGLAAALSSAPAIAYESDPPTVPSRRPVEVERVRYLRDDLTLPLGWGQQESRGLVHETYRLALTPGLVQGLFPHDVSALLPDAGYVDLDGDGHWWVPSGRVSYGDLPGAQRHFFRPLLFEGPFGGRTTVDYDDHDLVPVRSTDPVGNETVATIDYRVLAPSAVTDANGNRTEVAFDLLGMVTATARVGAAGQGDVLDGFDTDLTAAVALAHLADPLAAPAALLGRAGTRLVHDLGAFTRAGTPVVVATLAREVHAADAGSTRIQHALAYSDGFGREIQRKVQAEPLNGPRWTATGWTVFNNKSKPVQQFEPFFTPTHAFEADVRAGPTSTLFYDPPGRVVAVVNPDGSYGKTVLTPWSQREYDANDTVATDPRTDPDVGHLVGAFLATLPGWQPWAQAHAGEDAAVKAAAHAGTPLTRFLDSRGRGFLSRAHNGTAGLLDTRTVYDVEGNLRAVVDPLGRTVHTAGFDMLGTPVRRSTADAGVRWTLTDVSGQVVRSWDGRGHEFVTTYDTLRRPLARTVHGTDPRHCDPDTLAGPVTFELVEYGEGRPDDRANNLRGRVFRRFDQAGIVTNTYDFKGNVTSRAREVVTTTDRAVDWAVGQPAGERFTAATRFDALNRPTQTIAAHPVGSGPIDVTQPVYNEANLLERLDVWLGLTTDPAGQIDPVARPPSPTTGLANVDYDATGQRTSIRHLNGTTTTYEYDPATYRLRRLTTARPAPFGDTVQDLRYAYDPVGNVTSISDAAQATVFFRNQVVDAGNDYTYDALYRLIQATGREHVSQGRVPYDADDAHALRLPQPGDGAAMARYCETYDYDDAGNMLTLRHLDACPGALSWVRSFTHDADSNRLVGTTVGATSETFDHDPHGNVLSMAHLPALRWNFHDQLRQSSRQAGLGESTRYVYDADGNRARKVRTTAGGTVVEDRLYLGEVEVYRRHTGAAAGLERRTLHLLDGTRRLAMVETRNGVDDGSPQQAVRYQYGNHLGSAVLELDTAAAVLSHEEYSPYGSTTYQGVRADLDLPPNRYRYTGQERDEETGFNAHGARYYAPWLARWTSADPAGVKAGANLYRYCNDAPVMLSDPSGLDPPSPRLTPLVTDVAPTGVSGDLQFHDLFSSGRSVSGRGAIGLNARASFLLDVPQLSLNTSGLADLAGTAAVDTGLGRAGARLEGGLLLGEPSGLNLGLRGQGSFRFSVPERIGLGGLPGSLLPALTQGEGDLRLGGAVGYGSLSLATFRARAELSGGRFEGSLDATSIGDLARLRLDATGSISPSGDVSLESARLRASAGIPGFRLDARGTGTGNGSGGLDVRGSADLTLFGLSSLHATGTGTVSGSGVDFSARFSGAGPLYSSYITGGLDYGSRTGLSGHAGVFGLTYTPGLSLKDPSPPSPGTAAVLGSPANPWTPSGLTLGASYFGYRQGLVYSVSGGFMPDLSERILTNPRFGVTAQWHF